MTQRFTVYAVHEPQSSEVRYIGMTACHAAVRVARHVTLSRTRIYGGSRFHRWVASVQGAIESDDLGSYPTEATARAAERDAIKAFAALGHRLMNGHHNPTEAKVRDFMREYVPVPPEARALPTPETKVVA